MNNMKSYLNDDDVIGSIKIEINSPSGENKIWVIVEGLTDVNIFSKLIRSKNVDIQESYGGCIQVNKIVQTLLKYTDNIIGITDADFTHLEEKKERIRNVFLTDYHDIEMMLIFCNQTFSEIVQIYLNISDENECIMLRENILSSLYFIGGLKWINIKKNVNLNFKNLGLSNFYQTEQFKLNEDTYLNTVLKRSSNKTLEVTKEEVFEFIKDITDGKNLCNGHDFQEILNIYINSKREKGINLDETERAFILSYSFEKFKNTILYKDLKEWELKFSKKIF